jgi:hypothetical protein
VARPRAQRIAERDLRAGLEQVFEAKVREKAKQTGIRNARGALGWMNRRPIAKPVGE